MSCIYTSPPWNNHQSCGEMERTRIGIAFKMGISKRTVHCMYTNWYMEANSGSSRRVGEQLLAYHHSVQRQEEKGKQIGGWLEIIHHTLHIREEEEEEDYDNNDDDDDERKAYGLVGYLYPPLRNEQYEHC